MNNKNNFILTVGIVLLGMIFSLWLSQNVKATHTQPIPPGACQERPACLDEIPSCRIPEPAEGWCAPECKYQDVVCVTEPCYAVLVCATPPPPSQYNLREGDMISAINSNDPDIYIVNDWGYKRLFLNPIIFNFYGHLGGWHNVKTVLPAVRDAFFTTLQFRNCETNDPKVYALEVTAEDQGVLHHVQVSGGDAVKWDPNFFKKVFCINNNEYNWYPKGDPYTSVGQIPVYKRR